MDLEGLNFDEFTLESGQMIVWAHALTSLAEHVSYLMDRAKYYVDCPTTKEEYVAHLEHIADRIKQIQKTSQGEA